MKRGHLSVPMPVLAIHRTQRLDLDTVAPVWTITGLSQCGTMTVTTWDIISSLAAPHYGTFSPIRVYSHLHCYSPVLTMAAIFRGLTWRKKIGRASCRERV